MSVGKASIKRAVSAAKTEAPAESAPEVKAAVISKVSEEVEKAVSEENTAPKKTRTRKPAAKKTEAKKPAAKAAEKTAARVKKAKKEPQAKFIEAPKADANRPVRITEETPVHLL